MTLREIPAPYVAIRLPKPWTVALALCHTHDDFAQWEALPPEDKFDLIHDYAIDYIDFYGVMGAQTDEEFFS